MNRIKTSYVTKVGVLSAIAFILQVIGSVMGIKVAGFLEIEFSDLPAIIGSLALGPIAGLLIELTKNVLHLTISSTGMVGELANFVVNGSFVLAVGFIYKYNKTKKGAGIALILGCIIMPIAAAIANFFIMLPLYMPLADVNTKLSLVLTTITPFNFVRGIVLSLITLWVYKPLSPMLHK